MNIAFDIDGTLYKVVDNGNINDGSDLHKYHQELDFKLLNVLLWHLNNGDNVFIWSAGGVEYARSWMRKYLPIHPNIRVIEKMHHKHKEIKRYNGIGFEYQEFDIDICYDDLKVNLAKVNILVNRER